MRVHLVNPGDTSFGIGVTTPRWLYVLAAATPATCGDPIITDETLEQMNFSAIQSGDIVGMMPIARPTGFGKDLVNAIQTAVLKPVSEIHQIAAVAPQAEGRVSK